MLIDILAKSAHIEEIKVFYFETNHGQSEGDAVGLRSVIQRCLNNVWEMFVPFQLSHL